jgi:hypothetical protein
MPPDHHRRHIGLHRRHLLILQLRGLGAGHSAGNGSLKFYVAGLVYLLVGILVGTGLWVGWNEALRWASPKKCTSTPTVGALPRWSLPACW